MTMQMPEAGINSGGTPMSIGRTPVTATSGTQRWR